MKKYCQNERISGISWKSLHKPLKQFHEIFHQIVILNLTQKWSSKLSAINTPFHQISDFNQKIKGNFRFFFQRDSFKLTTMRSVWARSSALLACNPFVYFARYADVRPSGSTCHLLVLHSLNLVILVFPWWLNVTVLPRKLDNKPSSSLPLPWKSIIWRTTCRDCFL